MSRVEIARAMSEAELQKNVTDTLDLFHWCWTHFRPVMHKSGYWSTPLSGSDGFPDLVAVRKGQLIFAELKSERGTLSIGQRTWLVLIGSVPGIRVCIWRPRDWLAGTVLEALR